jgi:cytochrome bd-type quinol oxidase subunit 2
MKRTSIPLEQARNSLAKVWFIGAGIVFFILVLQSILGKYEGSLQEVWAWFVPTVLPTLALMLGVIGASALTEDQDRRKVKEFFFTLSKYLSLFYLLILTATILLEPFSNTPGIKLYNLSNYWLGPIQGLVVAAISVLFASQDKDAGARPATPGQ